MTWVEKITVAPSAASRADQFLKLALVDRVEAGEGLVEHDQLGLVDDGAEQLHGLRHALGEGADRFLRPVAKPVPLEQFNRAAAAFAQRKPAKRAHEGDPVHRGHRRIEAALLGQVADLLRRIERLLAAEQACACPSSGR